MQADMTAQELLDLQADYEAHQPVRHGNPERDVQQAVVHYLRRVLPPGSIVASIKNEEKPRSLDPKQRMAFVQKRKASGLVPGVPDLMCLIPPGRIVFIEMKAPGTGHLSPAQRDLHPRIRSIGFPVGVATSIDDARRFLAECGIELRERPVVESQIARPKRKASPRRENDGRSRVSFPGLREFEWTPFDGTEEPR